MAFSRRTPLRVYLFFEVFPIYGGRNVNDIEELQRRLNPFSFNPIWKLSLHSTRARPRWFETARRLIDGLVSWTRANEWQLDSRSFRLYTMYLIDSSPWYEAHRPRAEASFQPNFADLVASGSRGSRALSDIFRGPTITCSFYFAKERQEGTLLERVRQEQNRIKLQEVSAHERPRTPKAQYFSGPKSTRLRVDPGPEVDHVRSTLKWHFPFRYRSTRPCPMCSFTFWFSVSSLESVRLLLRLYLRKDLFSARRALDLRVSSSSLSLSLSLSLSFFFFLRG